MKKTTSFLFACTLLFLCFAFTGDEEIKGNQRAHYSYDKALPYDLGILNFESDKVDFQFYPESLTSKSDLKKHSWRTNYSGEYFNAYLINSSDSLFIAKSQDGSLMMIQEALDEDGIWKPIEYWAFSGCGNSYFNPLKLEPQHYVTVHIPKYSGDFRTKFRLKWKLDDDVRYTETFEGSIDKVQFKKETETIHGILYHGPASYFEK